MDTHLQVSKKIYRQDPTLENYLRYKTIARRSGNVVDITEDELDKFIDDCAHLRYETADRPVIIIIDNGYELVLDKMYSRFEFKDTDLLKQRFQAEKILTWEGDDREGCSTCDHGSNYPLHIGIVRPLVKIITMEMIKDEVEAQGEMIESSFKFGDVRRQMTSFEEFAFKTRMFNCEPAIDDPDGFYRLTNG